MAVTRYYSADVTISSVGTPQDITTITDDGIFVLVSDLNTLLVAELLTFNFYIKPRSGGTERLLETWTVRGAANKKAFMTIPIPNVDSLRIEINQTGGSARTLPTAVYQLDA
jgi:hypothetical protein